MASTRRETLRGAPVINPASSRPTTAQQTEETLHGDYFLSFSLSPPSPHKTLFSIHVVVHFGWWADGKGLFARGSGIRMDEEVLEVEVGGGRSAL